MKRVLHPFSSSTHGIVLSVAAVLLTACGGGDSGSGGSAQTITGSVGDGPVVGSMVVIADARGQVISSTTSDALATYKARIPPGAEFPLTVTSAGGTDTVTNAPPPFTMLSAALSGDGVVNINPFSTLIVKAAKASPGGLNESNVAAVTNTVVEALNFGLKPGIDPLTTAVTPENVASMVKANEALAEMLRRTRVALMISGDDVAEDDIVAMLVGDLTDGVIDGLGKGADPRVAATANIASGQILLETLTNTLKVEGADATARLDAAIKLTEPGTTTTTGDVTITAQMLAQARLAIAAAQAIDPNPVLAELAKKLNDLSANDTPEQARNRLGADPGAILDSVVASISSAGESGWAAVNDAVRENKPADGGGNDPDEPPGTPPPKPTVNLRATPSAVAYQRSATLTWSSTNATTCQASGAWGGTRATSGDTTVGPLTADDTFTLTCTGPGGSSEPDSVTIEVGMPPEPPPQQTPPPTVSLKADPTSVAYGGDTTLRWSSTDADRCVAGGAWTDSNAPNGMETVTGLTADRAFSLTCTGPGGQDSDSVNVAVEDPLPPSITFKADPTSVNLDQASTLTWTVKNATSCNAKGGWSGVRDTSGSQSTGRSTATRKYTLECKNAAGISSSKSVTVTLKKPTVTLTASPASVASGETVTLSWTAINTASCTASGAWAGSKSPSGSTAITPQSDSSYILSCSNASGTANDAADVTVTNSGGGAVTLSWTPPTTNSDGTALTDLAGYRIYYGTSQGNYPERVDVNDSGLSSYMIEGLPPATYYFVIMAFDTAGNESKYSNVASKTIR